MVSIVEQCLAFFKKLSFNRHYWLGLSGGLDSQVLLHICAQLRKTVPLQLTAVHIHHGLNPQADAWQASCESLCARYDIPFYAENVRQLQAQTGNLEATARDARYAVFAKLLKTGDVLLTAHHLDDQAETLLIQLCRGAGPKGLSAMPVLKPFARGQHARPLLAIARSDLLAYAQAEQLAWWEDDSNQNQQLTRNFIRHSVLPLLAQRWPSIAQTLARSAAHCAASEQALAELSQDALHQVQGAQPNTLSVTKLKALSLVKQQYFLRLWLANQGLPLPSTKKLATMLKCVVQAQWDRQPVVKWQRWEMRRHQDELYALPTVNPLPLKAMAWDLTQPLSVPGLGQLQAILTRGAGLRLPSAQLTVRFRAGGEVMHLGSRGHKRIKQLLQQHHIVPWQRDRIPFFYWQEQLIHVLGLETDPAFLAKEEEMGYQITFTSHEVEVNVQDPLTYIGKTCHIAPNKYTSTSPRHQRRE